MLAVTLAVMASGVKQQPLPLGEIFSQLPPLAVTTDPPNRMLELSRVATFRTCGRAFAPPNGMVKLIGFN